MPHFYDDPDFTYTHYWQGRDYEHLSELMAISRLLGNRKFKQGLDIGGGYGRILPHLAQYCQHLTLVEPSLKQRQLAKDFLHKLKKVTIAGGTSQNTQLKSHSYDLITVVRVLHHLPQPESSFKEIARLLAPDGLAIIEFANATNFKARLISWLTDKPLLPTPLERRSPANIARHSIDFVNHHPLYLKKLLLRHGLRVEKQVSVSNLRFPILKKILPLKILLVLEQVMQICLSWAYFGPSIFFLVTRVDNPKTL